jgi:hypothetical protein
MNSKLLKTLSILTVAVVLIAGCRRSDRDQDESTTASTDHTTAEALFNDVFAQVDEAAKNEVGIRSATITADTTANPKTLTIDFGPTNCTGSDGRTRRGMIVATFTGYYRDSNTVVTITPVDYYVNDYKVEGTKTVTNKGTNTSGNLWYAIEVENAVITNPANSWTISWESSRTREWIAGEATATVWDDVYLIDGTASGVGRSGNSFEVEITTDLRVEIGCRWIVSGDLEVRPQNLTTRYVDYGSGTCDNDAVVTVNGHSFDIEMN